MWQKCVIYIVRKLIHNCIKYIISIVKFPWAFCVKIIQIYCVFISCFFLATMVGVSMVPESGLLVFGTLRSEKEPYKTDAALYIWNCHVRLLAVALRHSLLFWGRVDLFVK